MQYTHVFFDLDGTVINSAPGITHSVQYALKMRDFFRGETFEKVSPHPFKTFNAFFKN